MNDPDPGCFSSHFAASLECRNDPLSESAPSIVPPVVMSVISIDIFPP
jgi:hypothetical protein